MYNELQTLESHLFHRSHLKLHSAKLQFSSNHFLQRSKMFPGCSFHQTISQSSCYDTVRIINTVAVEVEKLFGRFQNSACQKVSSDTKRSLRIISDYHGRLTSKRRGCCMHLKKRRPRETFKRPIS